jgi:hypothetical protein
VRDAALRLSLAAIACLSLPGCLSSGVMDLATGPRYRFAPLTDITDAAIADGEVFVRVEVLRAGRTEPEPVVLKVELDVRFWDQEHSVPRPTYANGLNLVHVPATELLAPGAFPKHATRLPIESVTIQRFEDLQEIGKKAPETVRVLAIHYRPVADDLRNFWDLNDGVPPPGDPLLAILRIAPKNDPDPIFISDIQDGHTTRRGWLVLMPLAAAGDAVVLPLEMLVAIVNGMD